MKHLSRIAALFLSLAVAARAEEPPKPHAKAAAPASSSTSSSSSGATAAVHHSSSVSTGFAVFDLVLNLVNFGVEVAVLDHELDRHEPDPVGDTWGNDGYERREGYAAPRRAGRERTRDARQGMLFSFGVGGGSLRYSEPSYGTRHGALDLDFRLGYGFSDRFQLFGDLGVDSATLSDGSQLSSWTLTMRGQTVLIGDRDGNGLNLNAGIGLGGLTSSYDGYDSASSPTGLALAAGVSYDARLGRNFSLSPELFYTWHQVPNGRNYAADVANTAGFRLNFLWYLN